MLISSIKWHHVSFQHSPSLPDCLWSSVGSATSPLPSGGLFWHLKSLRALGKADSVCPEGQTLFSAFFSLLCNVIALLFWLSQTLAAAPRGSWGRTVRTNLQEHLGRVCVGEEWGKQEALLMGAGGCVGAWRSEKLKYCVESWGEGCPCVSPLPLGPRVWTGIRTKFQTQDPGDVSLGCCPALFPGCSGTSHRPAKGSQDRRVGRSG